MSDMEDIQYDSAPGPDKETRQLSQESWADKMTRQYRRYRSGQQLECDFSLGEPNPRKVLQQALNDQLARVSNPMGWARTYEPGHEPNDKYEQDAAAYEKRINETVFSEYKLGSQVLLPLPKLLEHLWHDFQRGLQPDAGVQSFRTEAALEGPPDEMHGENAHTLSDYQLQDIGQAAKIDRETKGSLLLQDMGQGKTLQSITLHLVNKQNGPALIVAPSGLLRVWKLELQRNFPGTTFFEYKYQKDDPKRISELSKYDFVLVSLHRVAMEHRDNIDFARDHELRLQGLMGSGRPSREEIEAAEKEGREPVCPPRQLREDMPDGMLHAMLWERVILDEAHHIRNDGAFAKACYALRRKFCTLVTGTPQQNDFTDRYALMRMMRRDYAHAFKHFFGIKKNTEWGPLDADVALILAVVVRGMSVRWTNDSIFEGQHVLPHIETHVEVHEHDPDNGTAFPHPIALGAHGSEESLQKELEPLHQRWKRETPHKWRRVGSSRPTVPVKDHIFPAILRCRLGAVNPLILLKKSDAEDVKYSSGDMDRKDWLELMKKANNWSSTHINAVVDIVKSHFADPDNGAIVMISEYVAVLDLVEIAIQQVLKRNCLRRDGSVPHKDKTKNLQLFERQEKPEHQILLMTTRSGGEGLNLPQANRVITVCPSFNLYVDLQAWNRVLRWGQTRECFWHTIWLKSSYEMRQAFIQDRKLSNAESILEVSEKDLERARGFSEEYFRTIVGKVFESEDTEQDRGQGVDLDKSSSDELGESDDADDSDDDLEATMEAVSANAGEEEQEEEQEEVFREAAKIEDWFFDDDDDDDDDEYYEGE